MSHALELQALTKSFSTKGNETAIAVKAVDLTIPTGQIFGFLGANGAGKTTTIKMICGLIIPTSGSIYLNGYSLSNQRNLALQQIGAVLEGNRNIYWQLTPTQNLSYFGHHKKLYGSYLADRIEYLLTELDLTKHKNKLVGELSRGMQQKVAIACALIADPSIILLDEPTLGLDIPASRILQEWIEHLASEKKKTILLTTHQLDIAERLCDRIGIMRQGKLISDTSKHDLMVAYNQDIYEIAVEGAALDKAHLFPDMRIVQEADTTIFSGAVRDQETLLSNLALCKQNNLSVVSFKKVTPNLEEIFMHLVEK